MKRFALRRKSDGKFLSTKQTYGGRKWVDLNARWGPYPALFTGRSALSNAAACTQEYIKYFNEHDYNKKYNRFATVRFSTQRGIALHPQCPVECVEFDMLLVEGGVLSAKEVREQL